MSLNQWKAVYDLAKRWDFAGIRKQALEALKERMKAAGAVEVILLYRELPLDLDEGFVSAIRKLVVRDVDLSEADAKRLGLTTVMRICTIRGRYQSLGLQRRTRHTMKAEIREAWNVAPPGLEEDEADSDPAINDDTYDDDPRPRKRKRMRYVRPRKHMRYHLRPWPLRSNDVDEDSDLSSLSSSTGA